MKVIVAVEDREYGEAIADFVAKHSWDATTEFKVVHVLAESPFKNENQALPCCDKAANLAEEQERRAKALVMSVSAKILCAYPRNKVEEVIKLGSVREQLSNLVEEWNADLLVMGSHGKGQFQKMFLGSVSTAMLTNADCSVIIVRLPQSRTEQDRIQKLAATNAG